VKVSRKDFEAPITEKFCPLVGGKCIGPKCAFFRAVMDYQPGRDEDMIDVHFPGCALARGGGGCHHGGREVI